MPEPLSPDGYNPPSGDINFSELFPAEGSEPQVSATPEAPPQPQTPPAPEFFLRTEKSVYKTAEEAARGVSHKDELIDRYRTFLKTKGIDPESLQEAPKPEATNPNDPYTYLGKKGRLFEDFSKAVNNRDAAGYDSVFQNAVQEQVAAVLGPLAPLISDVAQQRAVRRVNDEAKDFGTFRYSEDFNKVRTSIPLLDNAIKAAESDYRMAEQLPDLYKMVYLIHQGTHKPEQVVPAVPPQATQPVRPTMTSQTSTPPTPSGPTNDWASNKDSRKQLIRDMEGRGIRDLNF